jgi:hypothetical protein
MFKFSCRIRQDINMYVAKTMTKNSLLIKYAFRRLRIGTKVNNDADMMMSSNS